MAGLQSCLGKIFVINNLRLVNKYGAVQQFCRSKHYLSCDIYAVKTTRALKNPNLTLNSNFKNLYRLSSTSASVSDNASSTAALTQNSGVAESTQLPGDNIVIDETLLPPIPTISVPAESGISEVVTKVLETQLKEPSFESLGLSSWWPPGIIRSSLEFLHIDLDLPWWGAILTVTIILRLITLPLTLKAKKNAINLENNLPQLQVIQMKLTEAKNTGNYYDSARYLQEMNDFIKEKNIATFGFLLPMLTQTPIFLSMFWGLRKMTNLPVESMTTGGILWFENLTISDPYYALPIIIGSTMFLIIETGAEGNSVASVKSKLMKNLLRCLPIVVTPFTVAFPAGLQFYWVVSNGFALGQALLLKIYVVRKFLNIPERINYDQSTLPMNKKGAIEGFKESISNYRLVSELNDRERLNTVTFEKAGSGPIPRTFKKDPTKQKTK